MPQDKLKVHFLGSGHFAVPLLEALAASKGLQLVGVGTQPDRPAGRKRHLTPTPVGRRADELGLNCERIPSVNDQEFLARMASLGSDLIIVVSFGQLLKERILNLPRLGCLNVHASLLPKHRGASPIASAILEGDAETGVCFMRMDKGLDTGPVYSSHKLALGGTETADSLEATLASLSASKVEEIALRIAAGELVPAPQDNALATVSRKIRKQDGSLDWNEDSAVILRKVRAYRPWPGVSFTMASHAGPLTVRVAEAHEAEGQGAPGQVLKAAGREWVVACGKGAISIARALPQGRREMTAADFLHGSHLKPGEMLLNGPHKQPEATPSQIA
jgi:methionyl-tRNA formyltransferase